MACLATPPTVACATPAPPPTRDQGGIDQGGRNRITDMAFLRKRPGGNYSLSFKWKGKSYIKALGTEDEQVANQIKQEAEDQLARIRRGQFG